MERMRLKKVTVALVLTVVLVLMVAFSGVSFAEKKAKFVVGHSPGTLVDMLRQKWSKAMEDVVVANGGIVYTVDSQNDAVKQQKDIEDLFARGIDILVVNPTDADAIVPSVEEANRRGIPVVCMDRTANGGVVASYIAFGNYTGGYLAGEYIAMSNGFKGKVVNLQGTLGGSVVQERGQGFRDAIAKYPEMKIVSETPGNWVTDKAMNVIEDVMIRHPDIIGIWAHSDSMIVGAVQVLKEKGKVDQVVTVGMGLYGGGPELIQEGSLWATWALFPEEVGRIAGEVVVKIANDEEVEEFYPSPLGFVTQKNYKKYEKYRLD